MASLDPEYNVDVDVHEVEADIVDEYERPVSRLGFFGDSSEEFPHLLHPEPQLAPARVRRCSSMTWTRSLFRKLTPQQQKSTPQTSSYSEESDIAISLSPSSSTEDLILEDALCFSSDDSDSDSDSDEEFDQLLEVELFHVEQEPPPRTKYNCLPSPLHEAVRPASLSVPVRHDYEQHGYSRHALHHVKWFWSLREDECAYGGVKHKSPIVKDDIPILPPMSVHPRRGDLASLRDPFCSHMDRYFVGMPMWTMSKALWMYDLHIAGESRRLLPGDEDSDNESCDSDETLVDSDGDGEIGAPASPVKRLRKAFLEVPVPDYAPWETSWYKRTELLLQLTRQPQN
ncbi:hypothetical protein CPB85DRAFT_1280795 [Mucidula mucida]|nr:hypothetical protein CPB85DRAFT_1280795 [Mucidula mucida]